MKEFKGVPFYAIAEDVFTVNSEAITSVYADYTTQEQDEELATLFAAAPELLSALQGVIRVADRETDEFIAARAAVAKALGESQ
ncbi:hypothetical protein [Erwinia aphidicola]|uniref:Uncharacterized protein n=1 Tax=Erwinia aphidicola TaxID=68334 RepID=A0ABU8DL65_ERWAP